MVKTNIKTITSMGLLFALAIVLSFAENLIPPVVPTVPGVKLGLTNIVTMYCMFYLGKRAAFTITVLKALFVFLTRGVVASLMSLSGGLCAVVIMLILLRFKHVSYTMVSIGGAVAHNFGQILVASLILNTFAVAYFPVLLISGIIMGLVTGTLLKVVLPALHKL